MKGTLISGYITQSIYIYVYKSETRCHGPGVAALQGGRKADTSINMCPDTLYTLDKSRSYQLPKHHPILYRSSTLFTSYLSPLTLGSLHYEEAEGRY